MASSGNIVRFDPGAGDENEQQRRRLLRERQVRVKTMLAHVRSLAQLSYDESADLEAFYEIFDARLQCLSRAQAFMGPPDGPVDLKELLGEELLAYALHMERHIEVDGPDIAVDQRIAPTLALAFHEIVVDWIALGAMARAPGYIVVRWRIDPRAGEDYLLLEWCEDRFALDHTIETSGFGRRLIEARLPREIGGSSRLEATDDGLRCVLEIPFRNRFSRSGTEPIPFVPVRQR